ncbi:MAG: hypothetical protein ACD_76C00105G0015 [uncultured bacterium]|nr:MAG: hypothetical protein ACD_76C00105G0015 [uncultured bacterium]HBD05603.1 hypothetical protein [Candidatus Uhrbacteria bacterium]
MSHTPNYDSKVKAILDATKPSERVCALTGEKWFMDEEEIAWYKKINVPPATVSPYTRACLTYAWGIGVQWWWNKDSRTGKPLLTYIHPSTGYKVMTDNDWYSCDFSQINYEINSNTPVLEQFHKLLLEIPFLASRNMVQPIRSIAMTSVGDQDSYFVTGCKSKNVLFSTVSSEAEQSSELYQSKFVTDSFNIVHSRNIHNCKYLRESSDCINCSFLFDSHNCENCFGGTNLRNRKFIFFNKQLSEQEYNEQIKNINLSCRSEFEKQLNDFAKLMKTDTIWPENFNENTIESSGEYLKGSINCKSCYFAEKLRDSDDCTFMFHIPSESCYCVHGSVGVTNCYYSITLKSSANVLFSNIVVDSQNLEYCFSCYSCNNCFGCVGLNHKSFCIFNKQYSEDEYWKKLDEIKCKMLEENDYGNYVPAKWSTGYIPESPVGTFMLGDMKIIKQIGSNIFNPNENNATGIELDLAKEAVNISDIPDCIEKIDIDINEWIGRPIFDPDLNRRFAYIRPELEFYKKHEIFPPNKHFISRMKKLYFGANSYKFEDSKCKKCNKSIIVAKNAEFSERNIYCKQCYLEYIEQNG